MSVMDRENDLFYINKTLYVKDTHLETVPRELCKILEC